MSIKKLLPTPDASDRRSAKSKQQGLSNVVKRLLRTPDANCSRGAKSKASAIRKLEKGMPVSINDQVAHPEIYFQEVPPSLQSPLLQADSLASLSVLPGSEKARQTTATSGLRCLGLSKPTSPLGWLARMLLASSEWNSTIVYLTWRTQATKSRHLLYQLVPSTPRTDGIDAGLWATATARDCQDTYRENGPGHTGIEYGVEKTRLCAQVKMWPTVHSSCSTGPGSQGQEGGENLQTAIGGQLNPAWVEWLMGYPGGWTDLNASETP